MSVQWRWCRKNHRRGPEELLPQIKTTLIGSYPVPSWLAVSSSRQVLRDAVIVVLKTQELAGLDLVGDGELNRFDPSHPDANGMIDYFVRQMEGIQTRFSRSNLEQFRRDAGLAYRQYPSGLVVGPVREGTLNLLDDFQFVRALTRSPLKFTCTGPHMLAKVLTDAHYGSSNALAMDLAKVLREQLASIPADVIQLDEANISGHPDDADWAAEAINYVLDGIHTEKVIHICFGNYGGQTIQRGFWKNLIPFLNSLHVDCALLEFARRGYDELEAFRELNSRIGLGLGVVDVKDNEVESPDSIAQRIQHAIGILGEDRIRYVHPDCGFWMLSRSVADRKMRALVQGRDLFSRG